MSRLNVKTASASVSCGILSPSPLPPSPPFPTVLFDPFIYSVSLCVCVCVCVCLCVETVMSPLTTRSNTISSLCCSTTCGHAGLPPVFYNTDLDRDLQTEPHCLYQLPSLSLMAIVSLALIGDGEKECRQSVHGHRSLDKGKMSVICLQGSRSLPVTHSLSLSLTHTHTHTHTPSPTFTLAHIHSTRKELQARKSN